MPYNQTDHTVSNKAMGIVGKSVDSRSQMRDGTAYRDFTSVSEALAYLDTEEKRKGHPSVFVTENGECIEYWFKNGYADLDLVPKAGGSGGGDVTTSQLNAAIATRAPLSHTHPANQISQDATHRFHTDSDAATWNGKQAALVSGTNIKTINGQSILGAGDIPVSGGGGDVTTEQLNTAIATRAPLSHTQAASTITEDASRRFVSDTEKSTWNGKQAALVSGTNIKTINGQSILGNGDIPVSGGTVADGSITNAKISASAGITSDKLADGANFVKKDGTVAFTAPLSMGYQRIMHGAEPVDGTDYATRNFVLANATTGGGYLQKLSTSGTTSDAFTTAIGSADVLDVDVSPTLSTPVTVPFGKGIDVRAGATFNGTTDVIIDGDFAARKARVFQDSIHAILTGRATRVRFPEWFGGRKMKNYRANNTDPSDNPDSLTAFQRALVSGDNINYSGQDKNYVIKLRIEGAYAVSNTINCQERTVIFEGDSNAAGGSCIKYAGAMVDADNVTRPVIKFNGCNYSMLRNIAINAPITGSEAAVPILAGVQCLWTPELNFPQRGIVLDNVTIGPPIGNENTPGNYWEFMYGLLIGTGNTTTDYINANNDFFVIHNLKIARCKGAAIYNGYDQAVDYVYKQINIVDCNLGMSFPRGGSAHMVSVYFDRGTRLGCIKGPITSSDTLRIDGHNVSMEHTKSQYFIYSDGPIMAKFTTGFVDVAFDEQIIANGLFQLIGGNCMAGPMNVEFDRTQFRSSGIGKIYIDCKGASNAQRIITFRNCNGAEYIYFRFPGNSVNIGTDFTDVIVEGRYLEGMGNRVQTTYMRAYRKHPAAVYDAGADCYWLQIGDMLAMSYMDTCVRTLTLGERCFQPTMDLTLKTRLATTTAASTQTFAGFLPGGGTAIIKTVIVYCMDGNTPPAGGGYIIVGYPGNDEAFGRVTGIVSRSINSKPAHAGLVLTSDTDLVLKSFNSSGVATPLPAGMNLNITIGYELVAQNLEAISYEAAASHPVLTLT